MKSISVAEEIIDKRLVKKLRRILNLPLDVTDEEIIKVSEGTLLISSLRLEMALDDLVKDFFNIFNKPHGKRNLKR